MADAVQARLLAAGTLPEALAADLWAAYCGAMVTWAIVGTGALRDWIAEHLERILAPHRACTQTRRRPMTTKGPRHAR